MPSLRERKARPSYSNIAEGLEVLEDSDEDQGPAPPATSENGVGSPSSVNPGRQNGKDSDNESLSSGDSSEFQPDVAAAIGGNVGMADEDDEILSDDAASEDDPMPEPEEEGQEDIASISMADELEPRHTNPRKDVSGKKGINPMFAQTSTNILPAAYRDVVQSSTANLSRALNVPMSDYERIGLAREDKARQLGQEVFPTGPVTPFVTRLKEKPAIGEVARLEYGKDEGSAMKRREARQRRGWTVARSVPSVAPWQTWEGEGWWPGMYEEGYDAGKGRPKGWKLREEVRLGYDTVGRMKPDEVVLITQQ
jgi:transcription factor C subunit 6